MVLDDLEIVVLGKHTRREVRESEASGWSLWHPAVMEGAVLCSSKIAGEMWRPMAWWGRGQ